MSSPTACLYSLARRLNNFYLSDYRTGTCLPFLCDKVQVGQVYL